MTAETKPEFRIDRLFDAPRAIVWQAWTDPAKLGRWFGPKGSRLEVLALDLRPGGAFFGRFTMPGVPVYHARFVYREIAAPELLVWEHGFADETGAFAPSPFGGNWPLRLLNSVRFAEEGSGTRILLSCAPIDATPAEEAAFAANFGSMNGGWGGSFEVLDSLLAG